MLISIIVVVYRKRYTSLMCYISRTESDGTIVLFDGRRVSLSLPSVQEMMPDLAAVTAPDGSAYEFITEQTLMTLGSIRSEDDLFVMVSALGCSMYLSVPVIDIRLLVINGILCIDATSLACEIYKSGSITWRFLYEKEEISFIFKICIVS